MKNWHVGNENLNFYSEKMKYINYTASEDIEYSCIHHSLILFLAFCVLLSFKALVPIYCNCMEKGNLHTFQNILFFFPQKSVSHTGLEQCEWQN